MTPRRIVKLLVVTGTSAWPLVVSSVFVFAQQQTLHLYSSLQEQEQEQEQEVKVYISAFKKSHPNIKVAWVRLSTGQMFARITAERSNPQASIWFGGSTDQYILAASEGLFAPYKESLGRQNTPVGVRFHRQSVHLLKE